MIENEGRNENEAAVGVMIKGLPSQKEEQERKSEETERERWR